MNDNVNVSSETEHVIGDVLTKDTLSALPGEAEVVAWRGRTHGKDSAYPEWDISQIDPTRYNIFDVIEPLVTLTSLQAMQARAEAAERERDEMATKLTATARVALSVDGQAHNLSARLQASEARVKELEEEVANLRAATNQSRLAFSGMVSVQSAIDLLDKLGGSNG